MRFLHNKCSFISNDSGLIKYCMTFGLGDVIKPPSDIIYVYKYNLNDLIEINYQNDLVITSNFDPYRPKLGGIIEDDWAFFESYFIAANLKNTKFILDTSLKLPIRYTDFEPLGKKSITSKETLFVTNNKKEGYITDKINIFIAIENTRSVDNCILSMFSQQRNISKPINNPTNTGLAATIFIAGLLSGVKSDELEENVNSINIENKLSFALSQIKQDSKFVREACSFIKTNKLYNLVFSIAGEKKETEFSGEAINFSKLVSVGLNNFIKSVKDHNKKIRVNLDVYIGIKYMYIKNGAAFVDLSLGYSLNNIKELLLSEEVYSTIN